MTYKILLVGDISVGKTCILNKFIDESFNHNFVRSTICVDFQVQSIVIDEIEFKLQLWDISRCEKNRLLMSSIYKYAQGIMIVYDISDHHSFEHLENILDQIDEYGSKNICKILVGNKCDIDNREISSETGEKLAKKIGANFFEASAKTGTNIYEIFMSLTRDIVKKAK